MKKDKVIIQTTTGKVEVEGYALRFENHDHDFVVHREYVDLANVWTRLTVGQNKWVVTHKESGKMLPFQITANTLIDAITYAEVMMLSITPELFNRSLMKTV